MQKLCKCLDRLDVHEHIADFGSAIAGSLVEEFGSVCPALLERAILHAIARMVHIQVLHADNDLDDETMLHAAEQATLAHANSIISTLAVIMAETQQETTNGSYKGH